MEANQRQNDIEKIKMPSSRLKANVHGRLCPVTSTCIPVAMRQSTNRKARSFDEMLAIEESTCQAFVSEQAKVRRRNPDGALVSAPCWREKVTQWCYDVVDHLGERRELVYIAMNILDRFTNCRPTDHHYYQVEAMSALFLAVRIAGSGNLSLEQLVSMSRKGICQRDIVSTGKSMIAELTWDHHLQTPADFVHFLVGELAPRLPEIVRISLLDSALFVAELAVFDHVLSSKRPSVIAVASTLSALHQLDAIDSNCKREIHGFLESRTARLGDIALIEQRVQSLFSDIPDVEMPHVILDDE